MRKYLVLLFLFAAVAAVGQATRPLSCTLAASGTCNMGNTNGAYGASFEEIPAGGPATVSVTIQGCMQGNTCDTAADTNTSTTATVRGVTFSKVYDYFKITVGTLTGGTSPTITINSVVTTANNHAVPTSAQIVASFTGCSGTQYLGADGACHNAGGSGTVTSAAQTVPSWLSVAGSPITTSGTFAITAATGQTSHQVIGTCGAATSFAPCVLVAGDLPVTLQSGTTLVAPLLGTPASGVATNITGLPISTGVSGLGTGVATFLATPSSANLISAVTDETGTGALVFGTAPTITLANGTGLPISTGVSGLGAGVATFLATPSSANLITAVTDETGTGALVFGTAPTITLANGTGLPISTGVSGLGTGVGTFLATPSSSNLASALTDEVGAGSAMFGAANSLVYYGVDSGAANAYVVTTTPALAAYTTGVIVCFVPTNAPTGASTVNVSGLGLKNWMKTTTTAVAALAASGDMITTTSFCGQYDGTQFVLLNPSSTIKTAGALTTNGILRGNSANQATGSGGILSTGGTIFNTYNSIATVGLGLPPILAVVNSTAQTAAISTATLCTAALCGNGTASVYHLHFDFWGSGTACSSVTAGSVTFLLTWTDENAVTHTAVALQMMGQTGAATEAMGGTFPFQTALANESASGDFTFSTNGTIVQYATGYTACTTGTGTYNLRAFVTRGV